MYRLEDLKIVGRILIAGGVATLLVGVVAQLIVGFVPGITLLNNAIYFGLFAFGWFMFNQLVMSGVFGKLVDDTKRAKLLRVASPLVTPPSGRFARQPFQRVEIGLMVIWAISVVVLQLSLNTYLTLPVGGFAGGWLVGGGLGRLRFVRMVSREQTEQQRLYYFSDSALGPATQIAFYSCNPAETVPLPSAETEKVAAQTPVSSVPLPPGIKRRGHSVPASPGKSPRSGSN